TEMSEPAESGGDTAEEPAVPPAPPSGAPEKDGRDGKAVEKKADEKALPQTSPLRLAATRSGARAEAGDHIVPAGPATRRRARELGIDLGQVPGSAPGGRVTQEDVKSYVRALASQGGQAGRGISAPPLPDFEHWGPVERKALDGVRRKTAEHMSLAW